MEGTLILGAGLSGLSCAHHLRDRPYRVIEKDTSVGGLAKTRRRPYGFSCDGTGHWLHLRKEETKALVHGLLGDNLEPRTRRARIYSRGVFTHYPFQANTFGLPKEIVAECLVGLVRARYEERLPPPKSYAEWIRKEFGEGISKHFMFPYNEKIYGVPLDTLAASFAEKYIPRPSIEAVIHGALGLSPEAMGYNATFVYPKTGGIGALSEALHQSLHTKAELSTAPRAIDHRTRAVALEGGASIPYGRLVSTIPLPDLIRLLAAGGTEVPAEVIDASTRLRASSVLYFDVGIRGAPKEHQDYHWIYVPEADFPFYRVGSYSAVERSLAPPDHRSYYVELGVYGDVDPSKREQEVLDGLRRLGIVENDGDVLFMIPNVLSPAYVLFDAHYEASRKAILEWLEHRGIQSIGRYGRWQYNAMEDAILEGKEAAARIAG
jgi:protoporphyrinogen oxidase